jgi:hypothetical protein
MVTDVCKNKHVVGDSEIFGIPANISEDRHFPLVYKFLVKNALLQILIGWIWRAGRLLNLYPPSNWRKIKWLES